MFYKIHFQLIPICMPMTPKHHLQPTCTENTFAYMIPLSASDYHLQSFYPRAVRDWNTLPEATVELGTLEAFRRATVFNLHLLVRLHC